MRRAVPVVLLLLSLGVPAAAQHALADAGPYDPAVPTPASVLGYPLGARFTPYHVMARYAEAVAAASPRVRLDTVAVSYEGRGVLLLTITSDANQARLAAIREATATLADPFRRSASPEPAPAARNAAPGLDQLAATTPAVVWLGFTIHGNEGSGVEAGLGVLYQLAAGQDSATRMVLDSVVVLIDPVQNPDGHERHVQDVLREMGAFGPDPYPGAMIQTQNWPGGRTSHYLFDLNRDWFLHTHPETLGRMRTFAAWHPQVAVDLHEMGSGSTYFFAPPMQPINPNVPASIRDWWGIYARANADALAADGWGFFTREGYDEFYPGYGVSWPVLTGAVGMTYEEASSGGGAIRRDDGTVVTLRDAARKHYTAAMATLAMTAHRRSDRVRDYVAFRRSAVTEAERAPLRAVVLEPDAGGRADALARVLLENGIEVGRLSQATSISATPYGETRPRRVDLPASAWVIDLAQPQGRLARALLEPDASLDSAFIRDELEARRNGQRDRFYDITAWSLPFTFRVHAWGTGAAPSGVRPVPAPAYLAWTAPPARPATISTAPPSEPPGALGPGIVPTSLPVERARYAYAFGTGSDASLRMLARLLADSVRVRHATRPFRVGAADFPHGAFLVVVNRNAPDIHDRIRGAAAATGARVAAVDNALVDAGADLGSNSVVSIPVSRVALVGGEGVSSASYGAAWYAFDRLLGFPVTRVEAGRLARALGDFNVVVLPSAAGLDAVLGDAGTDALRRWVRAGGTLVTLDAATAWLDRAGIGRLKLAEPPAPNGGAPLPVSVPGAIVRAEADTLSPLLAGIAEPELLVLLSGDRVYRMPDDARPGEAVLRYAGAERLRVAGYLWPEVPARVAGTPCLWTESVGAGRVVAFTGDPNFRAMWRGLLPVFANAVFLGPTLR